MVSVGLKKAGAKVRKSGGLVELKHCRYDQSLLGAPKKKYLIYQIEPGKI